MKAYRYITGPDDAEFCKRITKMLNNGWVLAGPATLTFNNELNRVICGQTLLKERDDIDYSDDIQLADF